MLQAGVNDHAVHSLRAQLFACLMCLLFFQRHQPGTKYRVLTYGGVVYRHLTIEVTWQVRGSFTCIALGLIFLTESAYLNTPATCGTRCHSTLAVDKGLQGIRLWFWSLCCHARRFKWSCFRRVRRDNG